MAKLITVCGATGGVGGSVARRMLKEGWTVRAITRNTESTAAKALAEKGAQLVSADYDDVASLEHAFKDSNAIFGITNIFEYLLEKSPEDAASRERQQLVNIATAADKTSSLEHLVLHTLPAGKKLSDTFVPHFDGKDQAADIIKDTLPSLAQKTTFLWIGFFSTNFHAFPMMRPTKLPNSGGAHIYIQPSPPTLPLPFAGDVETNAGHFVKAILAKPEVSLPAKYAFLYTSRGTFQDYLQAWVNVTGRRTTFVSTTLDKYEEIWGPYGTEIGLMLKACEGVSDWADAYDKSEVVNARDLGIPEGTLVDLQAALEKDKALL